MTSLLKASEMMVPQGPRNSRASGVSVRECQSVTRPGPGDVAKSELTAPATALEIPGGATRPASGGGPPRVVAELLASRAPRSRPRRSRCRRSSPSREQAVGAQRHKQSGYRVSEEDLAQARRRHADRDAAVGIRACERLAIGTEGQRLDAPSTRPVRLRTLPVEMSSSETAAIVVPECRDYAGGRSDTPIGKVLTGSSV